MMRAQNRYLARCSMLVAGGGLALALAGCGGGSGSTATPTSSGATSPPAAGSTEAAAPSSGSADAARPANGSADARRLVRAGSTALERVGSGTVTSVDAERGGTIWEVDVVTSDGVEHEVHVSRNGTTVLSGPRAKPDDAEDRAENLREARSAKLGHQAAVGKALAARDGRITEVNLDDHHGRVVWEADVHHAGTTYQVKIDASSGAVVTNTADHGDQHND